MSGEESHERFARDVLNRSAQAGKSTARAAPRRRTLPPPEPWLPAPFGVADASALRACANGAADRDQQIRAMRWIIEQGAATYQLSYRPTDRDTAFAEGRRAVGLRLVAIINMPADRLAKIAEKENVGQHSHTNP